MTNHIKHDMILIILSYITKIFIIHIIKNYPNYIVFDIILIAKIS